MTSIVTVKDVSKKYCKSLKHTMSYGIRDIARNALGMNSNSSKLREGEFWAVDDVSFEVEKGKSLGIIGANGSGKTTLLKLLNGIFMPDKGRIEIYGRVGALIEVGAGFHPLLTGRENIYVNGAILGMSKKEIDRKLDAIIDFADIGDFIDSPVKHYSSGMYVRLGFAIAIHTEPDILLMDEILAVGDAAFQKKCFSSLRNFTDRGGTLLFVSHDLSITVSLCDQAVLFFGGKMMLKGSSNEVINYYKGIVSSGRWPDENVVNADNSSKAHRFGAGGAEIVDIELCNAAGKKTKIFFSGEKLIVKFCGRFDKKINDPVYGLTVKDKNGLDLYMSDTFRLNKEFPAVSPGSVVQVEMEFSLPLIAGTYFITVVISELGSNGHICLDGIFDAIDFSVLQENSSLGIVDFDPEVRVTPMKPQER